MSSPVLPLLNNVLEQMGAGKEFFTFFDEKTRTVICQGIIKSCYQAIDRPIIFDTNRAWCAHLPLLNTLFDDVKVICCVRNPAWVVDSFEVIHRKQPLEYSRMYNSATRSNVYTRSEALMSLNGTVGSAWSALKEAYYSEFSEQLLLLDYDLLTQHPKRSIELLYDFLGHSHFKHNFDQVDYQNNEFDSQLGVRDLHTVHKKVEFKPRRTILPPDLFKKYSEMAFWQDTAGTAASVIAPKQS